MADEDDSAQEKTQEPTSKKLEKAREEGQVARSKELNTLLVLMAGSLGLLVFGSDFFDIGIQIFRFNMILSREVLFDDQQLSIHIVESGLSAARATIPFFLLTLLAAFVGPAMLGGLIIAPKALEPKFSRMSFIKGIGRMFSVNALMELLKALAKFLVVAAAAILILYLSLPKIQMLGQQSVDVALPTAAFTMIFAFMLMSLSIIVIVLLDVPFQILEHTKKLKMTHQEIKDELKNTEGRPEVKSRIRQVQQELAKGRMMSQVPDADVVITNPTHFAVALKYDGPAMTSPKLVAKGVDNVAAMIREVATANKIPIVSYPVLARSLYYSTDIDQSIPQGLYMAVAQILAYVFQLGQYQNGGKVAPKLPGSLEIPEEFVQMANR